MSEGNNAGDSSYSITSESKELSLRKCNIYCGERNGFDVKGTNVEEMSRSRLLRLSLAMNIVKVKTSEGKETADEIIKTITHRQFCCVCFLREFGTVEKCEDETKKLVEHNAFRVKRYSSI